MLEKLKKLHNSFNEKIWKINNEKELLKLENDFLWKSWNLKEILVWIKDLKDEEKKEVWVDANKLKIFILEKIELKKEEIEKIKFEKIKKTESIDVSLEYPIKDKGHMHPISITSLWLEEIFISLWFKIEDWPQIETEEYNFDKLNIPDNHSARDLWDTFWISDKINKDRKSWDKYLLRTHTSPVQIRTMLKWKLPIKIIVPWRVFRYEKEDSRHTSNFYQLEWLVVWEWVTFWNLKWTLDIIMKKLLWEDTKTRFRPSMFPFTEPSAEVDVNCQICKWKLEKWDNRCNTCSETGWIELLGAGMVHPKVLEWCNINPEKYSWFAFGIWIDRIAAQIFWVESSRMFYQNRLKFNEQF